MEVNSTLTKNKRSAGEQKRIKAVELEYEEPANFKILSSKGDATEEESEGEILTLDEHGILLLTTNPLKEGSFINLSIKFKGLGLLEDILGKVKKVEESEEHDFYIGVELYTQEKIKAEALSGLFPEKMKSFKTKLKKNLLDYFNTVREGKLVNSSTQKSLSFTEK